MAINFENLIKELSLDQAVGDVTLKKNSKFIFSFSNDIPAAVNFTPPEDHDGLRFINSTDDIDSFRQIDYPELKLDALPNDINVYIVNNLLGKDLSWSQILINIKSDLDYRANGANKQFLAFCRAESLKVNTDRLLIRDYFDKIQEYVYEQLGQDFVLPNSYRNEVIVPPTNLGANGASFSSFSEEIVRDDPTLSYVITLDTGIKKFDISDNDLKSQIKEKYYSGVKKILNSLKKSDKDSNDKFYVEKYYNFASITDYFIDPRPEGSLWIKIKIRTAFSSLARFDGDFNIAQKALFFVGNVVANALNLFPQIADAINNLSSLLNNGANEIQNSLDKSIKDFINNNFENTAFGDLTGMISAAGDLALPGNDALGIGGTFGDVFSLSLSYLDPKTIASQSTYNITIDASDLTRNNNIIQKASNILTSSLEKIANEDKKLKESEKPSFFYNFDFSTYSILLKQAADAISALASSDGQDIKEIIIELKDGYTSGNYFLTKQDGTKIPSTDDFLINSPFTDITTCLLLANIKDLSQEKPEDNSSVQDILRRYVYPETLASFEPNIIEKEEQSGLDCLKDYGAMLKQQAENNTLDAIKRTNLKENLNNLKASASGAEWQITVNAIKDMINSDLNKWTFRGEDGTKFDKKSLKRIDWVYIIDKATECIKDQQTRESIRWLLKALLAAYLDDTNLLCNLPKYQLPRFPSFALPVIPKLESMLAAAYKAISNEVQSLVQNAIKELLKNLLELIGLCEVDGLAQVGDNWYNDVLDPSIRNLGFDPSKTNSPTNTTDLYGNSKDPLSPEGQDEFYIKINKITKIDREQSEQLNNLLCIISSKLSTLDLTKLILGAEKASTIYTVKKIIEQEESTGGINKIKNKFYDVDIISESKIKTFFNSLQDSLNPDVIRDTAEGFEKTNPDILCVPNTVLQNQARRLLLNKGLTEEQITQEIIRREKKIKDISTKLADTVLKLSQNEITMPSLQCGVDANGKKIISVVEKFERPLAYKISTNRYVSALYRRFENEYESDLFGWIDNFTYDSKIDNLDFDGTKIDTNYYKTFMKDSIDAIKNIAFNVTSNFNRYRFINKLDLSIDQYYFSTFKPEDYREDGDAAAAPDAFISANETISSKVSNSLIYGFTDLIEGNVLKNILANQKDLLSSVDTPKSILGLDKNYYANLSLDGNFGIQTDSLIKAYMTQEMYERAYLWPKRESEIKDVYKDTKNTNTKFYFYNKKDDAIGLNEILDYLAFSDTLQQTDVIVQSQAGIQPYFPIQGSEILSVKNYINFGSNLIPDAGSRYFIKLNKDIYNLIDTKQDLAENTTVFTVPVKIDYALKNGDRFGEAQKSVDRQIKVKDIFNFITSKKNILNIDPSVVNTFVNNLILNFVNKNIFSPTYSSEELKFYYLSKAYIGEQLNHPTLGLFDFDTLSEYSNINEIFDMSIGLGLNIQAWKEPRQENKENFMSLFSIFSDPTMADTTSVSNTIQFVETDKITEQEQEILSIRNSEYKQEYEKAIKYYIKLLKNEWTKSKILKNVRSKKILNRLGNKKEAINIKFKNLSSLQNLENPINSLNRKQAYSLYKPYASYLRLNPLYTEQDRICGKRDPRLINILNDIIARNNNAAESMKCHTPDIGPDGIKRSLSPTDKAAILGLYDAILRLYAIEYNLLLMPVYYRVKYNSTNKYFLENIFYLFMKDVIEDFGQEFVDEMFKILFEEDSKSSGTNIVNSKVQSKDLETRKKIFIKYYKDKHQMQVSDILSNLIEDPEAENNLYKIDVEEDILTQAIEYKNSRINNITKKQSIEINNIVDYEFYNAVVSVASAREDNLTGGLFDNNLQYDLGYLINFTKFEFQPNEFTVRMLIDDKEISQKLITPSQYYNFGEGYLSNDLTNELKKEYTEFVKNYIPIEEINAMFLSTILYSLRGIGKSSDSFNSSKTQLKLIYEIIKKSSDYTYNPIDNKSLARDSKLKILLKLSPKMAEVAGMALDANFLIAKMGSIGYSMAADKIADTIDDGADKLENLPDSLKPSDAQSIIDKAREKSKKIKKNGKVPAAYFSYPLMFAVPPTPITFIADQASIINHEEESNSSESKKTKNKC